MTEVIQGRVVGSDEKGGASEMKEALAQVPNASIARSAAQYGRMKELVEILDSGDYDVNERDDEGCTLLQWAAINNRIDVIKMLLSRGAEPSAVGGILQENALQWAVRQGHIAATVLLREAGSSAWHKGVEGVNALHLACRYGRQLAVAYLIARDETISKTGLLDLPDDRGRTPLMICVEWYWTGSRGNLEALRVLVALGASINFAEPKSQQTALHLAAERGLEPAAIITLVDAGAVLNAEDAQGRTPEAVAKASGNYRTAGLLRSLSTHDVCSLCLPPLFQACDRLLCRARRSKLANDNNSASSGTTSVDDLKKMETGQSGQAHHESTDSLLGNTGDEIDDEESQQYRKSSGNTPVIEERNSLLRKQPRRRGSNCSDLGVSTDDDNKISKTKSFSFIPSDPMLAIAAIYGMTTPTLVGGTIIFAAVEYGWIAALAAAPLAPGLCAALAPKKAGRYAMCGFTIASILVICASFFAFGFHSYYSPVLVILYVISVGCLVTNFVAASAADPGIVDKPRHQKIRAIVDLAKRGRLADADLCATCLVERPPRSKHDPTLGKCVRRFDHFCPYVANVVGQNNYLYFFLFLLFVVLTLTYHAVLVFPYLQLFDCDLSTEKKRNWKHPKADISPQNHRYLIARRENTHFGSTKDQEIFCLLQPENALITVATAFTCIHLVWVFALLAVHVNLVCSDQTTYESIRHTYSSHRHHPSTPGSSSHKDDALAIDSRCCAAKLRNTKSALCAVNTEVGYASDELHHHDGNNGV